MVKTIVLKQEAYPSEKVLLWAVTSQEVKQCIEDGYVPQIVLPNTSSSEKHPTIAVILAQDAHPDRTEKDYTVFPDYVEAILRQGARPVFIAYDKAEEQLEAASPDGILLLGGNFRLIRAENSGYEPRPQTYVTMIEYAQKHKLPLFAICGGEQMLAVYFGASVKVNINDPSERYSGHMQKPYCTSHQVWLAEDSQIRNVLNKPVIDVNSCHKTAVAIDEGNQHLSVAGKAADGVVEVVELQDPWNGFVIGVQWHPERLAKIQDSDSEKMFRAFVKSAGTVKDRVHA